MDIEKFDRKMSDALIRKLTRKQAKNFIKTEKDFNDENNMEREKAKDKMNEIFNKVFYFGFFPISFLWLIASFFNNDIFKPGGILFVSSAVVLTFVMLFIEATIEHFYDSKRFKQININEMDEILKGFSSSSELIGKGIFAKRFLRNKINVEKTVKELGLDYLMQETKQQFQQAEEQTETDCTEQKLDSLHQKLKEKFTEKWNSDSDHKGFFYEIKEFNEKYKNEISLPYKNLSAEKIKDAKIFLKNMEGNSDELYEHFKKEQSEKKKSPLRKFQKYLLSSLTLLAGTVFGVFMKNTNLFLISLFAIGIFGFTIEQCYEWFMKSNYFFNRKEMERIIKKYLPVLKEKSLNLGNENSGKELLQIELDNSENIVEKLIGKQKDETKYEYRNETELFKMFKKFNSEKELISPFSKRERILKAAEFFETLKENEIKNNL